MEVRHLRYFVAVAEELNFSRAAQRLHIAQPPLSQQIRQLEDQLGFQLLARGTRPLCLTEAGRFFQTQALEILARLDEAIAGTRRIGRGQTGWLGIGHNGSALNALLPPVLRRFRAEFPDVEVLLFEMLYTEQASALLDRRIHVGFGRPSLNGEDLDEELLYREPMTVAVPSHHPLAGRSEIAIAELAAEPVVLYARRTARGGDSDFILSLFRAAGVEPNIAVEAQNVETALGLVSAGFGVALTAGSFAHLARSGVRFVSLGAEAPLVPMKVAYRFHEQSPAVKSFLKIVRAEAALLPGVAPPPNQSN